MRKPLIGISCNGKGKDPKRYTLPIEYVSAVRRAGGHPVVLPPGDLPAPEILERLEGLLFSGGGDIEPSRYGLEPHPQLYGVDSERDTFELALAEEALHRRLPSLAICRGSQVLNVFLGGDLIQHLPDVAPGTVCHRAGMGESSRHLVRAAKGSRLHEVCGAETFPVSSCHHQAVRRLGRGVHAVAWAEDGTIEAFEVDGHPEVLAVQWHPEETAADDPAQQNLFAWLVELAGARASR